MAESKISKTPVQVDSSISSDLISAEKEVEFDSLDLKVNDLVDKINYNRGIALSPDTLPDERELFLSLPTIIDEHSKNLGLSPDGFARAATNQGLDLGELLQKVGREGKDAADVLKNMEAKGMVALKPLEQRKKAMKDLMIKSRIPRRGQQIRELGRQRVRSGEKKFTFTPEEIAAASEAEELDFKKIKDPSKRQANVAKIVFDLGTEAGLSRDQMSAILANGLAESKLDPFAKNKNREDSHGIWQFNRNAGEGKGFSIEQLQDPKFQMEQIINAVKTRDNLSEFRAAEADAEELTKQFMIQFERPKDQSDEKIKQRQGYLKQANRLLDQASKMPARPKTLAQLDREKRQQVLSILARPTGTGYVLKSDDESIGGDVRNEIIQPGSAEHAVLQRQYSELADPEKSSDPKRAQMIQDILAKQGEQSIRSAFQDRAFQDLFTAGFKYDIDKVARKLGTTSDRFIAEATVNPEGPEANIKRQIAAANKRHVALYLTLGKMGVPALMSYEFMDPENYMGEFRSKDTDSYLTQLFDVVGRNRVELIGLDQKFQPVYRSQSNMESMFDKLDTFLSLGSGALRRSLDGPDGESLMEALKKGSIQGVRDADTFTKLMLSREGAEDGGAKAFAYGSLGFLVDVLAPDPTLGLAKIAGSARDGVKAIRPFIDQRYLPDVMDKMSTAATEMVESQKLLTRASDAFAAGNYTDGRKFLDQAEKAAAVAGDAEASARGQLGGVMRQVDRVDGKIATELSRDVKGLTGKDAEKTQKILGFSDFGLKRDFVHQAFERTASRGDAQSQFAPLVEFRGLDGKIRRLKQLSEQIESGSVAGSGAFEIRQKILLPLLEKVNKKLAKSGYEQVPKKGSEAATLKAVENIADFVLSSDAAKLIAQQPDEFQRRLSAALDMLPKPKTGMPELDLADIYKSLSKESKKAAKIFSESGGAVQKADLKKELTKATQALAAQAESRGAANALVRNVVAKENKLKVEPVIQSVASKFEEIGNAKISDVALNFRNELEAAFPALRGDAAMHVARNLDDRLKAIARTTGETLEEVYEQREFKDIIGRYKKAEAIAQQEVAAQSAKAGDELVDSARAASEVEAVPKIRMRDYPEDIVDWVQDTQTAVRLMEEAPTVENFVLSIAKVARKELNADQMNKVTAWLATKGIKVTNRGSVFVAEDPKVVAQAEEAFAEAFTDYVKGAPPPTPEVTSAFQRIRNRLTETFFSAKNAAADGAKFNPSSEIEEVFEQLLRGQPPAESGAPNILKMIRRTLLDDLPTKTTDDYLMSIARESDRLGYPISVAELRKRIEVAYKKFLADPTSDPTIDLPGPVALGGLLAPDPKASYTLDEIGRGMVSFAARKNMTDVPAARKINLRDEIEAVKELTPTQMIDQYVANAGPISKVASYAFIGGDALYDMRSLPPKIRDSIKVGLRATQQSIGDTVKLIHEGDAKTLLAYITGNPQIKFKSGRNVMSAGHDMMGSSTELLTTYIQNFAANPQTSNSWTRLRDLLDDKKYLNAEYLSGQQDKIESAFSELVSSVDGSLLLKNIFEAAGYKIGKESFDKNSLDLLEALTYSLGITTRKGEKLADTASSATRFEQLYSDINKLSHFKQKGPVANRITALIAAHGQADKARKQWIELGIATNARTAKNFKKWIIGEGIDDPKDLADVMQAFRVHGYNPRFMEAMELDGIDVFVPQAARSKMALALQQATDPSLTEYSGDLFEAIGRGMQETRGYDEIAKAWTYRYLKTRMVRGHFLLKSRYFFMNSFDTFNQMAQITGFRPALIHTIRLIPQNLQANPAGQALTAAVQAFGPEAVNSPQFGEGMREALQKLGDEGADWAAKLLRSSKWRGDLNAVLDARPGYVMVNGVPVSNKALRQIGVEEGLSSSFDTAQLGTKIREAGEMFLRNQDRKVQDNVFGKVVDASRSRYNLMRELPAVAEDIAEGWSERERYGAMLTLVEMGVEPRKAARLVIDALYDYAGSMSKMDRHWLVNVFFPFWAFQKNANRQLMDVVFSPRGAYRLGVLNRSYRFGTEAISDLIYEDMVDPLGVSEDTLNEEEAQAYAALKNEICREFDVATVGKLPAEVKRQLRMALSGRDSIFEHGKWFEIDERGRKLRQMYTNVEVGGVRTTYQQMLRSAMVERPDRASLPGYYQKRDAILVPYAMNEANKKFWFLMDQQNRNATFTSLLLPEQSYKAAINHYSLVTATAFAMLTELMDAGPDYLTDAYSPDDSGELFKASKPLLELFQPDRALLASDIASMAHLKDKGVPYRVAGPLARFLAQGGHDILAVEEKKDPMTMRMNFDELQEMVEKGEILVGTDDPYLNGEILEPDRRYYMSGGLGTLMLKHSPFDELNNIMKKWEKTPYEQRGGMRGEIQKWARQFGVDIADVNPNKVATQSGYELKGDAGGEFEKDVKRAIGAEYVLRDLPDSLKEKYQKKETTPKSRKEDIDRIERLKKSDTGKKQIDL